ncbi:MAG TPA: ROK family transcriptional regulator [Anaerolineae bacterium]|nr:ROK family transcriptional regulator [Anaerolineae bacterium]
MKQIKTITATEMVGINRTAIIELIRREGPTSRTHIAKTLHISLPTVMRIVGKLIEEGFVRDFNKKEWSGGRRRSLIEFDKEGHITIGLDLGGTKFYGAVTDLGGNVLFEETVPKHRTKGEESYTLVIDLISRLLDQAKTTGKNILGIGIGTPGVTFHEKGIVEWAPSLEWRDFPLGSRIKEHFSLPVIIDNDVNLSALGEIWFGAGKDVDNLVCIYIGTGIGAGVVIDGALYRGAHQMAGEIGYLLPGREYLKKEYHSFGALELLAAGTGIATLAKKTLKAKKIKVKNNLITAEYVFLAHRRGEAWATEIIEEVIDYLTIAIAAVATFFDPELIILGGGVIQSADLLIGPIVNLISGKIPYVPPVVASSLGHRAAVLGAMINLLHNVSDFYVVRKLT